MTSIQAKKGFKPMTEFYWPARSPLQKHNHHHPPKMGWEQVAQGGMWVRNQSPSILGLKRKRCGPKVTLRKGLSHHVLFPVGAGQSGMADEARENSDSLQSQPSVNHKEGRKQTENQKAKGVGVRT